MRQRMFLSTFFSFILFYQSAQAEEKLCDINRPVVFGGLDWESSRFHNAVAKYVLEKGYDCRTDEIPGSSVPIVTGLIRGDIDVVLEIWAANMPEVWDKALKKGAVTNLGANFDQAVQGWFVPRYLVEGDKKRGIKPQAPDLKTAKDLKKYKKLFKDPENPGKGLFHNCILGWYCEPINNKKLVSYGLDKDFTNLKPGTGAALDASIASHYKKGKPFVTYYWSPTWVMGTFDLVQLKEPAYDKDKWEAFTKGDMEKVTEYPPTIVYKGIHSKFMKKAPNVAEFIKNYRTTTDITNKALAYMKSHKGVSPRDAAIHFLKHHKSMWQKWIPSKAVPKVEKALKSEKAAH